MNSPAEGVTWPIYRGYGAPDSSRSFGPVPPWRAFATADPELTALEAPPLTAGALRRGKSYCTAGAPTEKSKTAGAHDTVVLTEETKKVNAALILRRPLMLTGEPGCGKSSLAYRIAYELGLGSVLRWQVTSRSRLTEGLYSYDAVARLHDAQLATNSKTNSQIKPASHYIELGPLGTALYPHRRPRVLLIDEIDKGDLDLPNDLLNALDEGEYRIPQLVRTLATDTRQEEVLSHEGKRVPVHSGVVRCTQFPVIVMTSNGEREFPPAFLRRCIQLRLKDQDRPQHLRAVLQAQLPGVPLGIVEKGITAFQDLSRHAQVPVDQLLSAVFMVKNIDDTTLQGELLNLAMQAIGGREPE